jgi:hypothetical protein
MLVGSIGMPHGIVGFSDKEAWLVNHSGLPQETKDKWNAIRAIVMGK